MWFLSCQTCKMSYYPAPTSTLLFLLPGPSRQLLLRCSEETEPDVHISLIMSLLEYQSRASSHLTKGEVMKPCALKLNQTARGPWWGSAASLGRSSVCVSSLGSGWKLTALHSIKECIFPITFHARVLH